MLTKQDLLNYRPNPVTLVEVPGVGTLGIRTMTGAERDAWEGSIISKGKVQFRDLRAKLLVKVICDEAGVRMFTDDEVAAVSALPAPVVALLFQTAQRVNALTAEDVDELTKN